MATRADENLARLYEDDFGAWVEGQVRALRALAASGAVPPGLDLPRLIEEVEDLRTTERHEVEGDVIVIISCLLRLEYSPAAEPRRRREETV